MKLLEEQELKHAALAFGGNLQPVFTVTEVWNGTNWTEVNDMNDNRGFGLRSWIGYYNVSFSIFWWRTKCLTESYNGTNWTEVNNLNTARTNS